MNLLPHTYVKRTVFRSLFRFVQASWRRINCHSVVQWANKKNQAYMSVLKRNGFRVPFYHDWVSFAAACSRPRLAVWSSISRRPYIGVSLGKTLNLECVKYSVKHFKIGKPRKVKSIYQLHSRKSWLWMLYLIFINLLMRFSLCFFFTWIVWSWMSGIRKTKLSKTKFLDISAA